MILLFQTTNTETRRIRIINIFFFTEMIACKKDSLFNFPFIIIIRYTFFNIFFMKTVII